MLKRVLILFMVGVVLTIVWLFDLLRSSGQFKTIVPHFAGKCDQIRGVVGPEDITIHPETSVAYVSASDRRALREGRPANGAIYAFDLKAAVPELVDLTEDAGAEFHPHGISLFTGGGGQDVLFAVNHAGGRHSVEIYDLKDGQLAHRKTVTDLMLVSPNDLVAVGANQFYLTNDHRYTAGFMRLLEDYLRLKRSNVVYFDGARFREAASDIGFSNGINVSADGETLFLCATTERSLRIYDRDPSTGNLTPQEKIDLRTGVDNIEIDSKGHLWIGAHPQLLKFVKHARDPSKIAPSQILHLTPRAAGGYDSEEVYMNRGEEISASSVAAVENRRMLIGAVFDPKFLDCRK